MQRLNADQDSEQLSILIQTSYEYIPQIEEEYFLRLKTDMPEDEILRIQLLHAGSEVSKLQEDIAKVESTFGRAISTTLATGSFNRAEAETISSLTLPKGK